MYVWPLDCDVTSITNVKEKNLTRKAFGINFPREKYFRLVHTGKLVDMLCRQQIKYESRGHL